MNKALFLDRDGIINIDSGYVHQIKEFIFMSGIFELVKIAYELKMKIFVVTNQAGIGRGFYTEEQFLELTSWMCQQFKEANTPINKVYFCPTHPTHGLGAYKKVDNFRKPAPGMLFQARDEFNLDLHSSVLIGDKPSDIIAGNNAKVGLNILLSDDSFDELSSYSYTLVNSLHEAILHLKAA